MIKKTKSGFKVVSKSGKNLSKPGLSKSRPKRDWHRSNTLSARADRP